MTKNPPKIQKGEGVFSTEQHTIRICGTDCTAYFSPRGYSVEYEMVSGGNDGYLQGGVYFEDETARKAIVTLEVRAMTPARLAALTKLIYDSPNPSMTYFDPIDNDYRTVATRRGKLSPAQFRGSGSDGSTYWTADTLTLHEA